MTLRAVPVLTYHSVSDTATGPAAPFAVSRQQFDEHLDAMRSVGMTFLAADELLAVLSGSLPLPTRAVAITFDDGYADNIDAAESTQRHNIPAAVFVTPGLLAGRPHSRFAEGPMMAPEQVAVLAARGWTIGAHGWSHRELDVLGRSTVDDEVKQCKEQLEDLVDQPVELFAYPYGYHDARVRRVVAAAGFRAAFGVGQRVASTAESVHAISRITVRSEWGPEQVTNLDQWPVSDGRVRPITRAWQGARWVRYRVHRVRGTVPG